MYKPVSLKKRNLLGRIVKLPWLWRKSWSISKYDPWWVKLLLCWEMTWLALKPFPTQETQTVTHEK